MPPKRYICTIVGVVIALLLAVNILQQFSSSFYAGQRLTDNVNPRKESIRDHQSPRINATSQNKKPNSKSLNFGAFNYIRNPSKTCSNNPDVELVICVPVARHNFEGRRSVSDTWGSYAYQRGNKAVLLFFIGNGSASEPPEIEARIKSESNEFNDIVQEDYIDSYRNLSLKSISILKWVTTFCPNAPFVLKADIDEYVNIPNLLSLLKNNLRENLGSHFITGHIIKNARPKRNKNSKWYVGPSEFSGPVYPTYVSGGAYAMTGKAALSLYLATKQTPLFWLEDVYITGMCRKKADNVPIVGHAFMTNENPAPNGCAFRKIISGHNYTEAQKRQIHMELHDSKLTCK